MYWSAFPGDLLSEFEQMRREYRQGADRAPNIRGSGRNRFPALNVGGTPDSVQIFAFAPGLDPAAIELTFDRGVLTLAGERASELPGEEAKSAVHISERFSGRFRRVVNLPEDADPDSIAASYRDGVLHVTVKRRAVSNPRRISVE